MDDRPGLAGIHTNWTAPRRSGAALTPEELITCIFSALRWREFHGHIRLVADTPTVSFLDRRGMLELYDEVSTTEIDAIDPARYSPGLYSSLAKVVALRASTAPVAIIDLDLFLRRPLPQLGEQDMIFAHYEKVDNQMYPPLGKLPNPNGVEFPGWDDTLLASNTAIAAFGDQGFLEDYTTLALRYMEGNNDDAPIFKFARMLFAEQRLPPYVARRHQVILRPLTDSVWNSKRFRWTRKDPDQDRSFIFHHTWHRKHLWKVGQHFRENYCIGIVSELLASYPSAARLLTGDDTLARYTEQAQVQLAG